MVDERDESIDQEEAFIGPFRRALEASVSQPPIDRLFDHKDPTPFIDKAARYCLGIARVNREVNLTSMTEPTDMAVKHAADSVTSLLVGHWPEGGRVCDVGTGGGFPGAMIACQRPDLQITFLDSVKKKLTAVKNVATGVPIHARYFHDRAEDLGQKAAHRETYDVVVARALAHLTIGIELCLPLVAVGGYFVAMKGPHVRQELDESEKALRTVGGVIEDVQFMSLPFEAGDRTLIAIRKVKPTPSKYPRRAGTPQKNPL